MVVSAEGLRDVIAGKTAISTVDGLAGKLLYRGYNIHDLATRSTFEETAYLLWHGKLPTRQELADAAATLAAGRTLPEPIPPHLRALPQQAHPLDVLRTVVSLLGIFDPDAQDISHEANVRKAYRLTGQVATTIATWHRLRSGQPPVTPRADLSAAANFLYMLFGKEPDPVAARTMDVDFILHADHEFNASTFTARVITGTHSDMHSAITGAVGALKGPRHGGAAEDVSDMLEEIGSPDRAEQWVKEKLAQHVRIPGFGHPVYKTEDPRAVHLRRMARELSEQTGNLQWYEISEKIREVMLREKGLHVNVDFYAASVYHMLGIPSDLYTSIFAVSRIVGWTAHVMEQYGGRIIRPRAEYIGPVDLAYVPIDQR